MLFDLLSMFADILSGAFQNMHELVLIFMKNSYNSAEY